MHVCLWIACTHGVEDMVHSTCAYTVCESTVHIAGNTLVVLKDLKQQGILLKSKITNYLTACC